MRKVCVQIAFAAVFMLYAAQQARTADLPERFAHLSMLKVEHTLGQHGIGDITIYYNPSVSAVIDTVYEDMATKEAGFGPRRRLITTKIDIDAAVTYTIDFCPGMSVDPNFIVFRNTGKELKKLTQGGIGGTLLIVPGDGYLYVYGHTNNTFNQHHLYRVEGDAITEIEQPFFYVGLRSVTNAELPLRNDKNLIATLPPNTPVEVLLMKNEPYPNNSYLVKTDAGLVGWVRFNPEELYMWNKPNPIEGLFYKGD